MASREEPRTKEQGELARSTEGGLSRSCGARRSSFNLSRMSQPGISGETFFQVDTVAWNVTRDLVWDPTGLGGLLLGLTFLLPFFGWCHRWKRCRRERRGATWSLAALDPPGACFPRGTCSMGRGVALCPVTSPAVPPHGELCGFSRVAEVTQSGRRRSSWVERLGAW